MRQRDLLPPEVSPRGRTYVIAMRLPHDASVHALGTVCAPSRSAATWAAGVQWPAARRWLLVYAAGRAPRGLLAQALAHDGGRSVHGPIS
jgi:hypothetical protein